MLFSFHPHPVPLPEGEGTILVIFLMRIFIILGSLIHLPWIRASTGSLAPGGGEIIVCFREQSLVCAFPKGKRFGRGEGESIELFEVS